MEEDNDDVFMDLIDSAEDQNDTLKSIIQYLKENMDVDNTQLQSIESIISQQVEEQILSSEIRRDLDSHETEKQEHLNVIRALSRKILTDQKTIGSNLERLKYLEKESKALTDRLVEQERLNEFRIETVRGQAIQIEKMSIASDKLRKEFEALYKQKDLYQAATFRAVAAGILGQKEYEILGPTPLSSIESIFTNIDAFKQELKTKQEQLDETLKKNEAEMARKFKEYTFQIEENEKEVRMLRLEIHNLRNESIKTNGELERTKQELVKAQALIARKTSELSILTQANQRLSEKLQEIMKKLSARETEMEEKDARIQRLENQIREQVLYYEGQSASLTSKLTKSESVGQEEQLREALKLQETYKKRVDELEKNKSRLENEVSRLVQREKDILLEKDEKLSQLEEKQALLENEMRGLQARVSMGIATSSDVTNFDQLAKSYQGVSRQAMGLKREIVEKGVDVISGLASTLPRTVAIAAVATTSFGVVTKTTKKPLVQKGKPWLTRSLLKSYGMTDALSNQTLKALGISSSV